MKIAAKFFRNIWIIKYLPWSIYFNFHYFDLKTAIKLPVILNRPKIKNLGGEIQLNGVVKFGMIKLGQYIISTIPDTGIILDIHGIIIFGGSATIGSGSAICTGDNGYLNIGNNFCSTATLRISCFHYIHIGDDNLISWDCTISDTDFHLLKSSKNQNICSQGYGNVHIGDNCWIGQGCHILKNSSLASFTTVGAFTVITGKKISNEYSVISNNLEIRVIKTDVHLDRNHEIKYPLHNEQQS